MENQMKPEEALAILDQVCSGTSMGRQAHVQVIQAVAVLKGLIPVESNGDKSTTTEEEKDATTP